MCILLFVRLYSTAIYLLHLDVGSELFPLTLWYIRYRSQFIIVLHVLRNQYTSYSIHEWNLVQSWITFKSLFIAGRIENICLYMQTNMVINLLQYLHLLSKSIKVKYFDLYYNLFNNLNINENRYIPFLYIIESLNIINKIKCG